MSESNHHCVIVKNITPCGFDERNRVKRAAHQSMCWKWHLRVPMRNGKHLARRFDRFQSGYADKTREYIQSMKLRATALVNNSNSAAFQKNKRTDVVSIHTAAVEFNEDEPEVMDSAFGDGRALDSVT